MNLKLNNLSSLEGWVALLALIVTFGNVILLIVGATLTIIKLFSIELYNNLATPMPSGIIFWILASDLVIALIFAFLFRILKKRTKQD